MAMAMATMAMGMRDVHDTEIEHENGVPSPAHRSEAMALMKEESRSGNRIPSLQIEASILCLPMLTSPLKVALDLAMSAEDMLP